MRQIGTTGKSVGPRKSCQVMSKCCVVVITRSESDEAIQSQVRGLDRFANARDDGRKSPSPLLLHQRTLALRKRLGGIVRRNRGDQIVIVPRILRLFRLLHLEQIGRNETAAVGAKRPLAEQGIVGFDFLHLGDDLGAVVRIAAERFRRRRGGRGGRGGAGRRRRRRGGGV